MWCVHCTCMGCVHGVHVCVCSTCLRYQCVLCIVCVYVSGMMCVVCAAVCVCVSALCLYVMVWSNMVGCGGYAVHV